MRKKKEGIDAPVITIVKKKGKKVKYTSKYYREKKISLFKRIYLSLIKLFK